MRSEGKAKRIIDLRDKKIEEACVMKLEQLSIFLENRAGSSVM